MSDIKKLLDVEKIKKIISEMYIAEASYINSFALLLSKYIESLNIVANTFEDVAVKLLLQMGKDGRGGIIALQAILTKTQLAIVDHSAKIEHFMKDINFALDWDEKFTYHLMQQVAAVFSQEATGMRTSYTQFVLHYDQINSQNKKLLKKFGDAKLKQITETFRGFQTKLYEENTDFKRLCEELFPNQSQVALHTDQLSFDSIIILPIQRISKYGLFFKELLKELGRKKSNQDDHIKAIRWLELASDKIQLVSIYVDRCSEKPRSKLNKIMDFIMRREPKHIEENKQILKLETRIEKAEAQLCAAHLVGQHRKRSSSFDSSLPTPGEGSSTAEPANLLPIQLQEKYTLYKTPVDGDEVFHAIFGEVNASNMIVCKTATDKRKEIANKIRQRSQIDYAEPETQLLKLALACFIEKPRERLPIEVLGLIASVADITITIIVTEQGRKQKHRFNEGQQITVSLECIEGLYCRKLPSSFTQQSALAAPSATATHHAPHQVIPLPPLPTGKLKQEEKQGIPVTAPHGSYHVRKRSRSLGNPTPPASPPPAPVPTPAAKSSQPSSTVLTTTAAFIKSPRPLPPTVARSPRPASAVPAPSASIVKSPRPASETPSAAKSQQPASTVPAPSVSIVKSPRPLSPAAARSPRPASETPSAAKSQQPASTIPAPSVSIVKSPRPLSPAAARSPRPASAVPASSTTSPTGQPVTSPMTPSTCAASRPRSQKP